MAATNISQAQLDILEPMINLTINEVAFEEFMRYNGYNPAKLKAIEQAGLKREIAKKIMKILTGPDKFLYEQEKIVEGLRDTFEKKELSYVDIGFLKQYLDYLLIQYGRLLETGMIPYFPTIGERTSLSRDPDYSNDNITHFPVDLTYAFLWRVTDPEASVILENLMVRMKNVFPEKMKLLAKNEFTWILNDGVRSEATSVAADALFLKHFPEVLETFSLKKQAKIVRFITGR